MKNLEGNLIESCIRNIQLFNELAGNTFEKRGMRDSSVLIQANLIEEEYVEMDEAFLQNDMTALVDSVCDLTVVSIGMLHKLGIDPVEAMKEVNESNLSKFCKTEYQANASVKKYEGDSRYSDVHHSKVGDWWVIYGKKADTDGWKVLKGVNYKEPDFSQIMGE